MIWFKGKARPKEEHRMKEEWDRMRSPLIPNSEPDVVQRVPPSSVGGFFLSQQAQVNLAVPASYSQDYQLFIDRCMRKEHELYYQIPDTRIDPKLIGDDQR